MDYFTSPGIRSPPTIAETVQRHFCCGTRVSNGLQCRQMLSHARWEAGVRYCYHHRHQDPQEETTTQAPNTPQAETDEQCGDDSISDRPRLRAHVLTPSRNQMGDVRSGDNDSGRTSSSNNSYNTSTNNNGDTIFAGTRTRQNCITATRNSNSSHRQRQTPHSYANQEQHDDRQRQTPHSDAVWGRGQGGENDGQGEEEEAREEEEEERHRQQQDSRHCRTWQSAYQEHLPQPVHGLQQQQQQWDRQPNLPGYDDSLSSKSTTHRRSGLQAGNPTTHRSSGLLSGNPNTVTPSGPR